MAIDYSKWDKIELSDDSDIEVHPNVDKRSFIRWKQQDIHQKRLQRNQDIQTLEVQIPMYEELNKRVNKMLEDNTDDDLSDFTKIKEYLQLNFDGSKPNGVEEDASTYNEMIEDLLIQLKTQLEKSNTDPNSGELLRPEIENHVKKIDDVLVQQKEKLKTLYRERELHISSEDIHTGWDRSFLNKGDSKTTSASSSAVAPAASNTSNSADLSPASASPIASTSSARTDNTSATSVTASSAVSTGSLTSSTLTSRESEASSGEQHDGGEDTPKLEAVHPDTLKYSKLSTSAIPEITSFLKRHPHIINVEQKDALLMKAFDSQFEHDEGRVRQIVFFATLLQYIYDIISYKRSSSPQEISQIVDQFMKKLFGSTSNNPILSSFVTEVDKTVSHIKTRCEILSKEEGLEGGVETIQLRSLDDNSVLVVDLPDETSTDPQEKRRVDLFRSLPVKMQTALKTESLDEINKVFSELPVEESEAILEIFDEANIIGVDAILENENDFEELKDEYEKEQGIEHGQGSSVETTGPKIEELKIEDHSNDFVNTADIVD